MSGEEVEQLTGLPVIAAIPFDKNVLRCLSLGVPVVTYAPGSPASRAVIKLAARLCGERYREKKKNILSRLLNLVTRR